MGKYQSTKLFDGYSACFRQWKAEGTHCRFLHGYAVSFRVCFEGDLDERNWVWDFGGMKRTKTNINGRSPKAFFEYLLDHTTIVAEDDPYLENFKQMDQDGIIQLRILPAVGCERFAEYLYQVINEFLQLETQGRVRATKVEVYEHERPHSKPAFTSFTSSLKRFNESSSPECTTTSSRSKRILEPRLIMPSST